MTLTLSLLIITAQPLLAPPLPAPTTGFRLMPDDGLASRILAMDSQLRAPAPTWAAPAAGASFGVSALTLGLSVFAVTNHITGIAVLFVVLGVMVGVIAAIVGIVAGFFGWGDAVRRAQIQERRDKLLDELDKRSPTSAALPRSA
ncbi:MAG: hypothetical protein ABTQ32_21645 [Myxococcaceae bacterium]